jgi:hypothetical protein
MCRCPKPGKRVCRPARAQACPFAVAKEALALEETLMEPWYKVATPRKEVREGRSFNPDEFAIALEQVVSGTAPEDYRDPAQFFARTCFTRALCEHAGMVFRRLSGKTENTAPVLTLITQFGGGKDAHADGALPPRLQRRKGAGYTGVPNFCGSAGLSSVPSRKPRGRVCGQRMGPAGGPRDPLDRHCSAACGRKRGRRRWARRRGRRRRGPKRSLGFSKLPNAPVLVLFDEVLNFLNRHRSMAESFHAFIQNLTVAMTGTTHGAAVISLPRSQVEMTDWDHAMAGQDHQSGAARGQGPHRQRRDRDQRGRPPAAL